MCSVSSEEVHDKQKSLSFGYVKQQSASEAKWLLEEKPTSTSNLEKVVACCGWSHSKKKLYRFGFDRVSDHFIAHFSEKLHHYAESSSFGTRQVAVPKLRVSDVSMISNYLQTDWHFVALTALQFITWQILAAGDIQLQIHARIALPISDTRYTHSITTCSYIRYIWVRLQEKGCESDNYAEYLNRKGFFVQNESVRFIALWAISQNPFYFTITRNNDRWFKKCKYVFNEVQFHEFNVR